MGRESTNPLLSLMKRVPTDALQQFLLNSRTSAAIIRNVGEFVTKLNEGKVDDQTLERLEEQLGSHIYKFCRFFDFQDQWYDVYHGIESFDLNVENLLKKSDFSLPSSLRSLEKISSSIKVTVRIHHHSFEDNKLHLVVVEFVSRSPFARKMFKYLFFPDESLIIADSTTTGEKILFDLLLPHLQLQNVEKIRIRALNVSHAANKYKTKKLKVRIDLETSGVLGLHSITLEGDDILEARRKLLARQEETLNLLNLGPWISVETVYFSMAIKEGVKLNNLDVESLKALSDALLSST